MPASGRAVRKIVLTTHIVCSVGWLGAVVVFLSLAIIAVTSGNEQTVRAVYVAMDAAAVWSLIPLALGTVLTWVLCSLLSAWGVLRHYWVLFKLLIAIVSTYVLVLYLKTFEYMATQAGSQSVELADVRNASPILHAGAALTALLVATVLAVYKPRGLTPFGERRVVTNT